MLAVSLNLLSPWTLPWTRSGLYVSLGTNLLVVPADGVYLGWCLLHRHVPHLPSGWLLGGLGVATLAFACKLAFEATLLLYVWTWARIPGVSNSGGLITGFRWAKK